MAGYNNDGAPKCLVGNWYEERVLKDLTGVARLTTSGDKTMSTSKRVMPADGSLRGIKSTAYETLDYTQYKHVAAVSSEGPRARRYRAMLARQAEQRIAERTANMRASLRSDTRYQTSTQEALPTFSGEAYDPSKIGRRVMKTLEGKELAPGCRDEEFLAGFHLSKRRPKLTAEEHRRVRDIASGTGAAAAGPGGEMPVTLYSQRLSEGVFPGTAAKGGNPFARSAEFSTDVREPTKQHALATDTFDESQRGSLRSLEHTGVSVRAPAADLSRAQVLRSLRRRVRAAHGPLGMLRVVTEIRRCDGFAARAAPRSTDAIAMSSTLSGAARAAAGGRLAGRGADGRLSWEELSEAMRRAGVPLPGAELRAVLACLDTSGDGKVSPEEAEEAVVGTGEIGACNLEGALEVAREEMLGRLDAAGTGRVPVEAVLRMYSPGSDPAVLAAAKAMSGAAAASAGGRRRGPPGGSSRGAAAALGIGGGSARAPAASREDTASTGVSMRQALQAVSAFLSPPERPVRHVPVDEVRHMIGVLCSAYAWRDDPEEGGMLGRYLAGCWGMRVREEDVRALAGVTSERGSESKEGGGSSSSFSSPSFGGLGETGASALATRRGASTGRRRRVLVHHHDATEEEVTIFDDVGLLPADEPALRAKLRLAGIKSVHSAVLLD